MNIDIMVNKQLYKSTNKNNNTSSKSRHEDPTSAISGLENRGAIGVSCLAKMLT
jgi:hypothetical protein